MLGTIFAIEEFSTFDGPGIRTSVFLKGCPLKCQWCHNPEGQSFAPEYLRSPNGCLGCGACLKAGEVATGTPCLVEESVMACPRHLVRKCGEQISAEELVRRLEPKFWMLRSAGGGLTFSGGEPLNQPEFLMECLELLDGKIHRAVQTSGFANAVTFQKVLSTADYILFDLKHMDSDIHRHFTGVDNIQILENYALLASSGKDFITRIPLIPGVNDTEVNLKQTAQFLSTHHVDRIELLPYNTGAGAKYRSAGRVYQVDFDEAQKPQPHIDIFHEFGIEVTVL